MSEGIADCRLPILFNRPSAIENRQSCLSLAFLRRDRKERAKLLLNFLALAFGASDSLLIVLGHGQDQGEALFARFARVFIAGHKQKPPECVGAIL
jgi:hypothetical protein